MIVRNPTGLPPLSNRVRFADELGQSGGFRLWLVPNWGFVSSMLKRLAICASVCALATTESQAQSSITIERLDDGARVQVDGKPFVNLVTRGYAKPILYPVFADGQIPMTRSWPMQNVAGEAADHPHHKSIWYAHGDVNGVDFWSEKGTITNDELVIVTDSSQPKNGSLIQSGVQIKNSWKNGDEVIALDETWIRFGAEGNRRWIDFDISILPAGKPLLFGDTKEGFMAIRTHPGLQLKVDGEQGSNKTLGATPMQPATAKNSSGEAGNAIWGRPAKWVCYDGVVDGNQVSVMLMDSPNNFRFPTTWHARDYGLIAANPFGLHDFLSKPVGTGNHEVGIGENLRLNYRFLFVNRQNLNFDPEKEFEKYSEAAKERQLAK